MHLLGHWLHRATPGTCVNNQYCVQFKKGAFELGAEVCPIAMKYNDVFVDAFWNSRTHSFAQHLLRLMTSWAVVCDVYYLEPQHQAPNESPIDFAARVKALIAAQASLKNVDFDGYLKHFKPSQRYVEERQKLFAQSLLKRFPVFSPPAAATAAAVAAAAHDWPEAPAADGDSARQRKK